MKIVRSVAAALLLVAAPAIAQEFKAGDITIEQPWSRATPQGAPVAGGYMVIRNTGKTEDRLTGGSFAAARTVQVHEMSMQDGIMKMRPLDSGLAIPPGGSVTLEPNGYHLMFTGLQRPLRQGETVEGVLDFAHAGKITVEFKVGGMADRGPGGMSGTAPAQTAPGHDSMPMNMNMPMSH